MTSRSRSFELPEDDTIAHLEDPVRRAIGSHWIHRARAELGVAVAFEALLPRLRGVGAAEVVIALAEKAIADERRHGGLCAGLAARYLGEAVAMPEPRGGSLPDFGTGREEMEVSLIVLGMCCINESIASEWIRSCWHVATAPIAISANRHHLHDEIDHARLGWAHVGSAAVTPALRNALRSWVPGLIEVNVAEWKKRDPFLPAEGAPAHGHLSAEDNDDVIDAAVRDIVRPGLAHVGLM